mmetsp:Transcript_48580/g.156877  ORF Transcript_48580/g.156877 Transcript_48580/m.156877 type:complete len:248 (-) Transcript_48580:254-997(-)
MSALAISSCFCSSRSLAAFFAESSMGPAGGRSPIGATARRFAAGGSVAAFAAPSCAVAAVGRSCLSSAVASKRSSLIDTQPPLVPNLAAARASDEAWMPSRAACLADSLVLASPPSSSPPASLGGALPRWRCFWRSRMWPGNMPHSCFMSSSSMALNASMLSKPAFTSLSAYLPRPMPERNLCTSPPWPEPGLTPALEAAEGTRSSSGFLLSGASAAFLKCSGLMLLLWVSATENLLASSVEIMWML